MEEQVNQNISSPVIETQPPVVQPCCSKCWWLGALVVGLLLAVAIFYAGYQFSKKQTLPVATLPTPTPVSSPLVYASPSPTSDETANWKTYKKEMVTFKFPSAWIEKPKLLRGSGFTQEFEDPEGKFTFTFSSTGNYSQLTGEPYTTIDEFINMPYKVKTVVIDGQEGRQPLPRAGSENVNSIMFFSKDSKLIYTLELQTGDTPLDTPEIDVVEGQRLFDQILSTLRFN